MSRRVDHLEMLCRKLQVRFGRSDELALELQRELDDQRRQESAQPRLHDWNMHYSKFLQSFRQREAAASVPQN